MKLSRRVSWFLLAFGVWSWWIWITFAKNLWQDGSGLAFDPAGHPTAYFWVHLLLAIASFLLGTVIGVIGFRGVRALRQAQRPDTSDGSAPETLSGRPSRTGDEQPDGTWHRNARPGGTR